MINVKLKDGTAINCTIFEREGSIAIFNHERIDYLFSLKGVCDFIYFQTEMISGKFHPSNVVKYTINHENQYSYQYPRHDGYMRDWC